MIQFRSRPFIPVNPSHPTLNPRAIVGGKANGKEDADANEMFNVGGSPPQVSSESLKRILVHR